MPPFQEALESRHPAQPQPRRRHEHDHRSVLADAGRLLPAARAGQRPRLSGEQPRWSAGPATGHLPSGDRDGHHRGRGGEPHPRQGRHADPRQGGRHRRARRAQHQHLADEQRARHDRDDDEPQTRPRRADRGEGRVLEGQARGVGHRPAAAPDSSRRATGCSPGSTALRKSERFPRATTASAIPTGRTSWGTAATRGRTRRRRSTC